MVLISDNEAARGFEALLTSDRGVDIIAESGYG
jgi:hypothetical protein